jgi:hypothetical protein
MSLVTAALAALILALPAAASAGNAEIPRTPLELWKAVAASGKVESSTGGGPDWTVLARGDSVAPTTHVRTLRGGRATMTRGGDVILVHPRSELILPPPGKAATFIRQESGSVLYEIETRDMKQEELAMPVEVETPFLVAGVKGTVFSVVVQPSFVSVSVMEGNVEVRSKSTGEMVDLFGGDMALLGGRGDRFEVYRSGSSETGMRREEMSEPARTSRKEAYRLVRTAALEDETFEEMKLDLWGDFTKNEMFSKRSFLNLEREKLDLLDQKQAEQDEDTVRKNLSGLISN